MSTPDTTVAASLRDVLFEALVQHSGREKKYGPDLADALLDALRSAPISQRAEALGMECVGHMDASGTVWMGKGDHDRVTVFADTASLSEFVRGPERRAEVTGGDRGA